MHSLPIAQLRPFLLHLRNASHFAAMREPLLLVLAAEDNTSTDLQNDPDAIITDPPSNHNRMKEEYLDKIRGSVTGSTTLYRAMMKYNLAKACGVRYGYAD